MTQQEINELVKTIAESDDICTAILMIKNNEKEYKKSEFYKQTKVDLMNLIKAYKTLYPINWEDVKNKLQDIVNNLSLDNIENIMNDFITQAQMETDNFKDVVQNFKESVQ